ncbi:MAG: hypothetical protein ACLPTZ_26860, partial [Beijerinckiaceae bacterium]
MSQIHAKTDKLTLVAVAQPDGKMRVTSQSWERPAGDFARAVPGMQLAAKRCPPIRRGKAPSEWSPLPNWPIDPLLAKSAVFNFQVDI